MTHTDATGALNLVSPSGRKAAVTSVQDRMDPEVAEGLEAFFKIAGPGGLGAIPDLGERRGRLGAVMAMAAAAAPPSDDIETSDHLVPGPPGAPEVPLRV